MPKMPASSLSLSAQKQEGEEHSIVGGEGRASISHFRKNGYK